MLVRAGTARLGQAKAITTATASATVFTAIPTVSSIAYILTGTGGGGAGRRRGERAIKMRFVWIKAAAAVTVAAAMAAAMAAVKVAVARAAARAAVVKEVARVGTCYVGHPLAQHVRRRRYHSVACRIECCLVSAALRKSRRRQCRRSRRSRCRGSTAGRNRRGRRESRVRRPGTRRCWRENCLSHPRMC